MTHPPSDAAKAVELARAALEDDAKLPAASWRWSNWRTEWGMLEQEPRLDLETSTKGDAPIVPERNDHPNLVLSMDEEPDCEAVKPWIVAARTREPLLATSVLSLAEENETLKREVELLKEINAATNAQISAAMEEIEALSLEAASWKAACMMARGESAPEE